MKINIEIDATPEELKSMMNLPNLSGLVEDTLKEKIQEMNTYGVPDLSQPAPWWVNNWLTNGFTSGIKD